jgi:hypothetical protein
MHGGQIEIPDEHHTILGLHLKPEKFKTRVTKLGVLYVLHVITTNIPQNFEFKRLTSLEKIKIAHISSILERSQ